MKLTPRSSELLRMAWAADSFGHIGVASEPPHITPARGPPLWDECDAQTGEGVEIGPDWDLAALPAPEYEVDQRISW